MIVLLCYKAIAKSRKRIHDALHAIGLWFSCKHIVAHFALADLPKLGIQFDLQSIWAIMGAIDPIAPCLTLGLLPSVPLPSATVSSSRPEVVPKPRRQNIVAAPHPLSLVNHCRGL